MKIIPAIDIRGGKCVRLRQGDFGAENVYFDDPAEVACMWKEAGADLIHVVDLDGARDGGTGNLKIIERIARSVDAKIQTGGGIRALRDIELRLEAGVDRVIIGTKAIEDEGFVKESIRLFGGERIVIGIDAKDGMVAVRGWESVSTVTAAGLAKKMQELGVKTVIYTDISKDGMLSGPNLDYTEKLIKETELEVIASGGVGSMRDLADLKEIGASGVIVGKSLYEKRIDLKEALSEFGG